MAGRWYDYRWATIEVQLSMSTIEVVKDLKF
jgi:hypothetical protein